MIPAEPLIQSARNFAQASHEELSQKRKFTGDPYYLHPFAVAEIIKKTRHTPSMLAAAYLHDTIEMTDTTRRDIEMRFGTEIATMVEWLTPVTKADDGLRSYRMEKERAHLAKAPPSVMTIKLADIIDNCRNIAEQNPTFARIYLPEKSLLLDVLTNGNEDLWFEARRIVDIGMKKMGIEHRKPAFR